MEFRSKSPNHAIQFHAAKNTIGPFGKYVSEKGETLQFVNGRYRTDDPEKIKFIKTQNDYGNMVAGLDDVDVQIVEHKVQMVEGSRGTEIVDGVSDLTLIPKKKKGE